MDLESSSRLIAERDRTNHANVTLRSIPLHEMMVAPVRPTINALLAGVVLVVLVTCATTAAILLSRTAERRRELSVRSAVGASRGRIVSQLLTENVLLSLAGGGLGIVAGQWLVSSFIARMPVQQKAALPNFDNPGVGLVVAAMAMTISVATALLFGVIPAMRAARLGGWTTLRSGRTTAGAADMRVRSALVALQVAFALVLLAGAGLIGASVQRLLNVPYTFDPVGLITMRMNLPPKYDGTEAVRLFQRQLLDELHETPGIQSAGFINQAPLMGGGNNGDLYISGRPAEPAGRRPVVVIRTVSSGYFSSMRVPLLRGRFFGATDTMAAPQVVVINRFLADSVFAGTEPVGQRISFQFLPGEWQIVGIVDNERFDDIDRPLLPAVYFTADQQPTGSFVLVVRSSDTAAAVAATRRIVSRMDPDLPLFAIRTFDDIAAASSGVFLRRATLWMLSIFAGASLLLAAMGLYGVLAQSVADRTREIGVRVALGATRGAIVRLVMNRAFLSAGTGAIIGVAGTLLASKWLSSLVFGISPRDPWTIAMATTFLGVVAFIACLVPTIRALQIDPATAVRE
jgi:predicted permease